MRYNLAVTEEALSVSTFGFNLRVGSVEGSCQAIGQVGTAPPPDWRRLKVDLEAGSSRP